jgi:hypothetical protein
MKTRFHLLARACLVFLVACANLGTATSATNGTPSRNIGIEGKVSLVLSRPDYRPRPLDDRTEVILRIESVTPATNHQHRYDFYYMGLEPGAYSLADYLVRPDGTRPDELAAIRLPVRAVLPEDHDGRLNAYVARPFPFIGGYRVFLCLLGLVWAGGIVAFVMSYRKKRVVAGPVVVAAGPSLAERMRPLVEAAAMGNLSTEGQAQLERLLTGYWREKLKIPEMRMAEALARLREDAEAGAVLRALERWLHRRGGASPAEVSALLAPYRDIPAPLVSGGGRTL